MDQKETLLMAQQTFSGSAPAVETPAAGASAGTAAKTAPKFQAPKKKKKWVKRLIVIVVIVALLVGLLAMCSKKGTSAISGAYLPAQAQTRDITVAVTGPGTIKPNDTFRATTLVRGEILSAPFEEGDTLSKDDVLFTIDASNVEDAIRQAELGVEQAKDTVERSRAGVDSSRLSVDSAQLQYDSLLRTRNDNAEDRQVKANAAGVVNKLYVDPGDTVSAGTPIADILDRDSMKLTVPFHSVDAKSFTIGQSATVQVAGTAETLYGSISEIAATDSVGLGGTMTRNVTVTVSNPGALSPASLGTAQVGSITCAASGSFAYSESKQLIALYSGKLETLNIQEGDRVYKDQVVGEFEEKDFQDQIDAAEIALKNAQIGLTNAQISLRDAELALENSENALQSAKDNLDDYTITCPIDGTVIEKNYKQGDNIDPSTASATGGSAFMAVIYDMSRLTFDINVSERDVVQLSVGQKVSFTADALDSAAFTGVVEKININGTTVNGNTSYPVTVAVDGNGLDLAQQGLLPGMSVSANIIVEEVGSVLAIPVDAVNRENGGTVLVALPGALDENGNLTDLTKTEQRQVELGRNDSEYIEVLSGLEEGDTVLIKNSASNLLDAMMGM